MRCRSRSCWCIGSCSASAHGLTFCARVGSGACRFVSLCHSEVAWRGRSSRVGRNKNYRFTQAERPRGLERIAGRGRAVHLHRLAVPRASPPFGFIGPIAVSLASPRSPGRARAATRPHPPGTPTGPRRGRLPCDVARWTPVRDPSWAMTRWHAHIRCVPPADRWGYAPPCRVNGKGSLMGPPKEGEDRFPDAFAQRVEFAR